jgi:uncharacterized membrane protein YeaQ/YmgE (transglycosylase-associated protein family)
MTLKALIILILTGLASGWVASEAVRAKSFGFVGNVVIGIAGSFIASYFIPRLYTLHYGPEWLMAILNGAIGGIILLLVLVATRSMIKAK